MDFLLTAKRDRSAAARFLRKAIAQCGTPAKITIDQSRANGAAIDDYNRDLNTSIELRQVKYLNNIVEQDHRAIKRLTRPMLGFKSFWSAAITLAESSSCTWFAKASCFAKAGSRLRSSFTRWPNKTVTS